MASLVRHNQMQPRELFTAYRVLGIWGNRLQEQGNRLQEHGRFPSQ